MIERPSSPRDLPGVRDHLADQWRVGKPFDQCAAMVTRAAPPGPFTQLDRRFDARQLEDAALWWVDGDACALLEGSAPSFPADHVLTLDDLPHAAGLAVFARSIAGHDAQEERTIRLDALLWGPVQLPPVPGGGFLTGRPGIGLSWYGCWPWQDGLDAAQLTHPVAMQLMGMDSERAAAQGRMRPGVPYMPQGAVWVPLGRSDWLFDTPLDHPLPEVLNDPLRRASMEEDRRLIATLWALARQPRVIAVEEHHAHGPERRRAQRQGRSANVHVMALRPNVAQPRAEPRHVEWSHRWVVKAHWRNVRCGPGRTERRLVLVGPFVKGPQGLPLKAPSTTVWRVDG